MAPGPTNTSTTSSYGNGGSGGGGGMDPTTGAGGGGGGSAANANNAATVSSQSSAAAGAPATAAATAAAGTGSGTVVKQQTTSVRRGSFGGKLASSRSYPRGVGLDFRKLAGLTLLSYIDHHGVPVRAEAPPSELAVAVARHFEQMEVEEDACLGGFLERLERGGAACSSTSSVLATQYARTTAYFDGREYTAAQRKRRRSKWAARPGEQVAAKVTRTDENGSWILASVQRFYADTETYDVQDEDDTSKLIRLPWTHVMRLSTGTEGCFKKSTDCMAIFPETTSFYRAKVSKSPVWKFDRSGSPMVREIIVKFEDDEDASGRTPHRRVPSRFVIPIPADYYYDETEDVDLTPPGSK